MQRTERLRSAPQPVKGQMFMNFLCIKNIYQYDLIKQLILVEKDKSLSNTAHFSTKWTQWAIKKIQVHKVGSGLCGDEQSR